MRLNDIAIHEAATGERLLPTAYPDDPQPVECERCGGNGYVSRSGRRAVTRDVCQACDGDGVVEADV